MDLVPGAHDLPLAKLAFAGIVAAAILGRGTRSGVPLMRIGIVRSACAIAAIAIISVAYSIWLSASAWFVIQTFLPIVIAFLVTVKILARWTDVRCVLKALAVAGIILAGVAVVGYGGGRAVVHTMYDTNDLAYVLVGVLPLILGFGVAQTGAARIRWLAGAGMVAAASLLTQSRGGFIALLALVLALIWSPIRRPHEVGRRGGSSRGRLQRALVAVVLCVISWTLLPHGARERLASVTNLSSDYNANMNYRGGRANIWRRDVVAALERPIGYGVATSATVDGINGGQYRAPHSSLVQIFVELGVLGLLLWVRLFLLGWRCLIPSAGSDHPATGPPDEEWREQVVLAHAMRLSLFTLFVAGLFLSQAYALVLWQLLAACAAATVIFGTYDRRLFARNPARRAVAGTTTSRLPRQSPPRASRSTP
jgi:O-Antigen ligase